MDESSRGLLPIIISGGLDMLFCKMESISIKQSSRIRPSVFLSITVLKWWISPILWILALAFTKVSIVGIWFQSLQSLFWSAYNSLNMEDILPLSLLQLSQECLVEWESLRFFPNLSRINLHNRWSRVRSCRDITVLHQKQEYVFTLLIIPHDDDFYWVFVLVSGYFFVVFFKHLVGKSVAY